MTSGVNTGLRVAPATSDARQGATSLSRLLERGVDSAANSTERRDRRSHGVPGGCYAVVGAIEYAAPERRRGPQGSQPPPHLYVRGGIQAARLIKEDAHLKTRPAVVLVTAFGREEVREEAERIQMDGYLLKPVTASLLFDILIALFAGARQDSTALAPSGDRHANRLRGLRVLLAEDNEINQQIAVELLEGVGATVEVANNGADAVRKLLDQPFPPNIDVVIQSRAEPATIDACTSSTSSVARTARCTPAMRKTRVHANGRTTAAAARSTPRAVVRCSWCIRKRSGLWGRRWHASTW